MLPVSTLPSLCNSSSVLSSCPCDEETVCTFASLVFRSAVCVDLCNVSKSFSTGIDGVRRLPSFLASLFLALADPVKKKTLS